MKKIHSWVITLSLGFSMSFSSCVDEIAFGNSFLEKAPGGDVTEDVVFSSAEYTRQYLTTIYSWQYYGLSWQSSKDFPYGKNYWTGSVSYLTDCYQAYWSSLGIVKAWYGGNYTAISSLDRCICPFVQNNVWYIVRAGLKLIERIDGVPGLEEAEKKEMVAQAKCLMAEAYYDLFRHYGGLPLIKHTFAGTESSYELPRATVEETVNYLVQLLDEAAPDLPWGYDASNTASENYDNAENDMGHWTRAGAMALKCKVLLFAASPLFNDAAPYANGASDAEQQHLVWYGGYKQELWDQCYEACKDFFEELQSKGYYQLEQASGSNAGQYRAAFRRAYFDRSSKEILHSTRVTSTDFAGNYFNRQRSRTGQPTWDYMLKFAWADGRPFDWETAKADGELNEIFVKWKNAGVDGNYSAGNAILTRDPRFYETVMANGVPRSLSSDGNMSGDPYEIWTSGRDAKNDMENEGGSFGTGFANNKFWADGTLTKTPAQWPTLRLSDLILTYAEAKLQAKTDFGGAIDLIDEVRARVGMKSLREFYTADVLNDRDKLLELILNERVCELGIEDSRFYDLIRYKKKNVFERPLFRLTTYRLDGNNKILKRPWYGADKDAKKAFPVNFEYKLDTIAAGARYWWVYPEVQKKDNKGFDAKWYLSAINQSEIEKGYLIQNPGWE